MGNINIGNFSRSKINLAVIIDNRAGGFEINRQIGVRNFEFSRAFGNGFAGNTKANQIINRILVINGSGAFDRSVGIDPDLDVSKGKVSVVVVAVVNGGGQFSAGKTLVDRMATGDDDGFGHGLIGWQGREGDGYFLFDGSKVSRSVSNAEGFRF